MPEENNPCQQEPCKSAVADYQSALLVAQDAEALVQHRCWDWSIARGVLTVASLYLLAAMVLLIVCLNLVPGAQLMICRALLGLVFLSAISVIFTVAWMYRIWRKLVAARLDCHRKRRDSSLKYSAMIRICGVNCVPFVDVNCLCP